MGGLIQNPHVRAPIAESISRTPDSTFMKPTFRIPLLYRPYPVLTPPLYRSFTILYQPMPQLQRFDTLVKL